MPAPDVSLGNWLAQRARRSPHRRALTFEGTTWTYAEMQDRIDRLAGGLRAHGVNHGDRVAFLGFNQPAFFETMFAAARLGAIFVPLNFRLTGPELSYIINDAGVHTIVVDEHHRPVIDGIRDELPCRRYVSADAAADGWASLAAVAGHSAPLADARAGRRRRGGGHHVHVGHDRAAQGRHAHPRQPLVEQHQRLHTARRASRTT